MTGDLKSYQVMGEGADARTSKDDFGRGLRRDVATVTIDAVGEPVTIKVPGPSEIVRRN